MLFHTKELIASIEDPNMVQNPIVMTKIDLDTVSDFNFDNHQVQAQNQKQDDSEDEKIERVQDSAERAREFLGSAEETQSMEDLYAKGFDN